MQGAQIQLTPSPYPAPKSLETDEDGASLSISQPGTYRLTATRVGFFDFVNEIEVKNSSDLQNLKFTSTRRLTHTSPFTDQQPISCHRRIRTQRLAATDPPRDRRTPSVHTAPTAQSKIPAHLRRSLPRAYVSYKPADLRPCRAPRSRFTILTPTPTKPIPASASPIFSRAWRAPLGKDLRGAALPSASSPPAPINYQAVLRSRRTRSCLPSRRSHRRRHSQRTPARRRLRPVPPNRLRRQAPIPLRPQPRVNRTQID